MAWKTTANADYLRATAKQQTLTTCVQLTLYNSRTFEHRNKYVVQQQVFPGNVHVWN